MRFVFLRRQHHRGFSDFAPIKHVRDRGLDHAVEREKHLKPILAIKDLIKLEPSKSLPISIISQQKDSLYIPVRPIEFIRKYPTVFEEFLPGASGIHPHIKLTPQVLDLDSEEQLVYQSENYKQDVADRLLKLLMISRIDRLPLRILDAIKWDLGLPPDYVKRVVPEFPDYFRVVGDGNSSNSELELVCWSDELAVSVMEKKAKRGQGGYDKGMPIAFPMQFSRGFEMDKKVKKWVDEWQKLPYVSPYENAMHLRPTSDESDKWVVGILHEVLNLFVSKKVERDTLLYLGEFLGVRSRFKRALLHHPGIFYLSIKMGTYTVVLRDAYKRGCLAEKNQLMDIKNQYVHLMNTFVEDHKATGVPDDSRQQEKKKVPESRGQRADKNDEDLAKNYDDGPGFEDDDDDDYECSNDEEEEKDIARNVRAHGSVYPRRKVDGRNLDVRRPSRISGRNKVVEDKRKDKVNLDVRGPSRISRREKVVENNLGKTTYKVVQQVSGQKKMRVRHLNSQGKSTSHRNLRLLTEKNTAT